MQPRLKVYNISKYIGSLPVLEHVSFEVFPGEVVGLVGRSGAGKSLLASIITGLSMPDTGTMIFEGRKVQWPFHAQKLGVEAIHQRPRLAEHLDITANIFLGRELRIPILGRRLNILDRRRMNNEAARILEQLNFRFPSLREKVANLSSEQRQMLSIAQVMTHTAKLIVVDEPTGLDNYYRAREQAENLRHQQRLLEQNLAVQDTRIRSLIEQMTEQVKALDQANIALQDAHRRLLTEREQERKHLARELHDQLIQDLLSVNYQLEESEAHADVGPELKEDLLQIRNTIRMFVSDLRRICSDLRPPTIDSLGLGSALQSYTQDWSERTGIDLTLNLDSNLGRLPEAIELSIFRIVQEGLNNVRKHAMANRIDVTLEHTSVRALMISISDDGSGLQDDFDLSALSREGHFGLLGISERVALLGGRLDMKNKPEGGLLLQAEIPHPRVDLPVKMAEER
ncbi:MAG: ATP-binding cassette domain-containing protein [Anaerolineales bacterium]